MKRKFKSFNNHSAIDAVSFLFFYPFEFTFICENAINNMIHLFDFKWKGNFDIDSQTSSFKRNHTQIINDFQIFTTENWNQTNVMIFAHIYMYNVLYSCVNTPYNLKMSKIEFDRNGLLIQAQGEIV